MRKSNLACDAMIGTIGVSPTDHGAHSPRDRGAGLTSTTVNGCPKPLADSPEKLRCTLELGEDRDRYCKAIESKADNVVGADAGGSNRLACEIAKGDHPYVAHVDFEGGVAISGDVHQNTRRSEPDVAAADMGDRCIFAGIEGFGEHGAGAHERNESWVRAKRCLEARLGIGRGRDYYPLRLQELGYRVSTVIEHDDEIMEIEAGDGLAAYIVEVVFDRKSSRSVAVGVSLDPWKDLGEAYAGEQDFERIRPPARA